MRRWRQGAANTLTPVRLPDTLRPAAQAGRFYPSSPAALARQVEGYLDGAVRGTLTDPKAVVAPHAGYSYSGPVAGSAFAPWVAGALPRTIRRVVLLGPSHWVDFPGLALPDAGAMATPLGEVHLDPESVAALSDLRQVRVFAPAHEVEHSLEVELPFLQAALAPGFVVTPLVVGRASDDEVREVLERLWDGPETRFVLSSDLSHYLAYDEARRVDGETAGHVEALEATPLTASRACGYRVLRGFLGAAAARGLTAGTTDLRNSGDTAGPRHEVVGYGAFHFQSTS